MTDAGTARRSRAQDLVAVALLVALWLAASLPRLRGPIDLRWDASVYYVLGTSLAEGKGHRLLNEPGEIEAVQYPPGLPLLVAVHQRAAGTADFLEVAPRLRVTYFVLGGLYLLAAYAVVRAFLAPPLALAACALTGLSFYAFLHPSDTLYAELPFALASMLFLLCHRRSERPLFAVTTGVLGVLAYLLRTAGIALLAAWVGESLLRRRWRQAALRALASALPVLAWQVHVVRVTESDGYREPAYAYQRAPYAWSNVGYLENVALVDPFRPELGRMGARDLAGRVARNLAAIPVALGESAWMPRGLPEKLAEKLHARFGLPSLPGRLGEALLVLFGCGVLAGAACFAVGKKGASEVRGNGLVLLYFALTIVLISFTPWPQQFWRYLAPLAPLSALFLLHGLRRVAARVTRSRIAGALAVAAPLGVLLAAQLLAARLFLQSLLPVSYYDAAGNELPGRLLTYERPWHALDPALEWLRRHARAEDVVATTVPHLAHLRSGLRAVLPPMETDPDLAGRLLAEVPVAWVLLDELGDPGIAGYAAAAIERRPEEWRLAYGVPGGGTRVYERVR